MVTSQNRDETSRSSGARRRPALASVLAGLIVLVAGTAVAAGPSASNPDLMPTRTIPPAPTNHVGSVVPIVPLNPSTVPIGVGPASPISVGPALPVVPIAGVPTIPAVPTTGSASPTVAVIAAPAPPVSGVAVPSIPVGQIPPATVAMADLPVVGPMPEISISSAAYSCFANDDGPLNVRSGQTIRSHPDPWENDFSCGPLEPFSILLVSRPSHGVLFGFGGETIESTPYYASDDDYVGTDSFTYRWVDSDGSPISRVATYTFNVVEIGVDANDDAYEMGYGTTLAVPGPGVLVNDTTADEAGTVDASGHTFPNHGTLALHGSGAFEYTPDPGWFGVDTFVYTLANGWAGVPGIQATVTISVHPVIPCWWLLYHCTIPHWPQVEIPTPDVQIVATGGSFG